MGITVFALILIAVGNSFKGGDRKERDLDRDIFCSEYNPDYEWRNKPGSNTSVELYQDGQPTGHNMHRDSTPKERNDYLDTIKQSDRRQ